MLAFKSNDIQNVLFYNYIVLHLCENIHLKPNGMNDAVKLIKRFQSDWRVIELKDSHFDCIDYVLLE